jgi:hypothetical protein
VLSNVLLGALERVAARQVIVQVASRLAEKARIGVFEHVAILQEESEQRREVIDLHVAIHIGGRKTDSATLHGLAQHLEIVEPQDRMLAGRRRADGPGAAIGKNDCQRAVAWLAKHGNANTFDEPRRKTSPRRNAGIAVFYCCLSHWAGESN